MVQQLRIILIDNNCTYKEKSTHIRMSDTFDSENRRRLRREKRSRQRMRRFQKDILINSNIRPQPKNYANTLERINEKIKEKLIIKNKM